MPDELSDQPTVLITGANGFVGSRLCRRFIADGFNVIAGVRKTADRTLLSGLDLEYRYGDITRPDTLPDMVRGVDYIIHNAGIVKAKTNSLFFDVNERGTRTLMEAIVAHNPKVKKVVYVSSQAASGPVTNDRPVRESDEPHPVTTYGRSKLAAEQASLVFSHKVNLAIVRPAGVYGPGDKEILTFFAAIKNHVKPYFGNTKRKIQLVHVDDLTRAISLLLTAETCSGEIYFISEKQAYTMKEMIALLQQACGRSGIPLYIPAPLFRMIAYLSEILLRIVGVTPMLTREKANELLASWEVETGKAERDFGFVSQIAFAEGARTTYDWYFREGWL
jgi:nucleoside-diphosphate-sugar epimerase